MTSPRRSSSNFGRATSAETFLVQTMTAAFWRLLRMRGVRTAGFELEMARAGQDPSAGCGVVLAAVAFRNLADNSRALALQHRFETTFDRQYNRALAMLLTLRETPQSTVPSQLSTETWNDDFYTEPNFEPSLAKGTPR